MTVRKITLQLPEDIYQRLTKTAVQSHQSLNDVIMQALRKNLEQTPEIEPTSAYDITHTHTWALRGFLEIVEPDAEYTIGENEKGNVITNYAENVDDVLYGQA